MTGRHCKIKNFIYAYRLICDFDLIVNCDKMVSGQRRLIFATRTCQFQLNTRRLLEIE